ncbi:MAG: hypothetical protein AzoDbin1_04941 [Azoarcus sp.]|nr:hypothetical protein [Azoarcus sp.]
MILHGQNYRTEIETLVKNADKLDIAVAFWGKGAEALLPRKTKNIRILCNLTSGATNPNVIQNLQAAGFEVRNKADLHAKVAISDKAAIIGSANYSANGLNLEGTELAGWIEAGYLTKSEHDLSQMDNWFAIQWDKGERIDHDMLEEARLLWKLRSSTRIKSQRKAGSFLSIPSYEIEGRDIVLAFWREETSPEGESDANKYGADGDEGNFFEWYEDWFDKLQPEQTVIDVYIGPRGGASTIEVSGPYKILEPFRKIRQNDYKNYKKGDPMTIHLCRPIDELLGFKAADIRSEVRAQIARKPLTFLPKGSEGIVLSIEEFLKIVKRS